MIQASYAYCPELALVILSLCSYINIKAMNIISSDPKIITKKLSVIPEQIILPSFLKYVFQLIKEADK